jgi:hypothetical protein
LPCHKNAKVVQVCGLIRLESGKTLAIYNFTAITPDEKVHSKKRHPTLKLRCKRLESLPAIGRFLAEQDWKELGSFRNTLP